jgi:hypothetical protein
VGLLDQEVLGEKLVDQVALDLLGPQDLVGQLEKEDLQERLESQDLWDL